MDFLQILQIASIIVGLATAAGLGLQRGVVKNLREMSTDQKERIEFLEKERVEDKATIARQTSDNAALQRIVTGEIHWTAISDLLEHHHKAAEQNWRRAEDLMVEIRDDIRDLK